MFYTHLILTPTVNTTASVFILQLPEYFLVGCRSTVHCFKILHSEHCSAYVSSICKWWLIIYHSLHRSSELVVCSRPLPLPRTMGPFPVGCEGRGLERESKTGEYCKAGTSYLRVLPLKWKTDSAPQWHSWSVCWEVTGQDWEPSQPDTSADIFLTPAYRISRKCLWKCVCLLCLCLKW